MARDRLSRVTARRRAPLNVNLRNAYSNVRGRAPTVRAIRVAREGGDATLAPFALGSLFRRLATDCKSVVDIGTGLMTSLEQSPCDVRIGLDAHRPYLENRRVRDAVPVNASATDLQKLFVPGAVDLVTAIDVIEHFTGEEARDVLAQAESVAAKRVLLFTPRGHFPQEDHDAFGLGGEEFQRHRSTWEPEDLTAMGYRVVIMPAFHGPTNSSFVEAFGADAPPKDAIVAWKDL